MLARWFRIDEPIVIKHLHCALISIFTCQFLSWQISWGHQLTYHPENLLCTSNIWNILNGVKWVVGCFILYILAYFFVLTSRQPPEFRLWSLQKQLHKWVNPLWSLFCDLTRDSIADNFFIVFYCRCLQILCQNAKNCKIWND